jgi:hypothetical protein
LSYSQTWNILLSPENGNEQKQNLRRYLHDAIRSGYRYDPCVPYKMVFVSVHQAHTVSTTPGNLVVQD